MKKQKGKNQKAGASKKKEDTQEAKDIAPGSVEQDEDDIEKPPLPYTDGANDEQPSHHVESNNQVEADKQTKDDPETPGQSIPNRQPSLSLQSKMRSSSFRRTSVSQAPVSPSANGAKSPDIPMLTPDNDSVNSIYRKQAARLDELEKDNKRLAKDAQEYEKKWKHTEDELEDLREASGEVAELKSRAQKADAQIEELNKIVCLRVFQDLALGTDYGSETRKHLPSAPKFPAAVPILQTARFLAQPSKCFRQPSIISSSAARLQELNR